MGTWKVGELARRTGLTVRTLHHYDAIGLLRPQRRTPSGHRLYGEEAVERLHRIVSLRLLGLGLSDIRRALDRPGGSLEAVVRAQLERLDAEIGRQRRLRARLKALAERLESDGRPAADELLDTMALMTELEKYYTPAQLEKLERRAEEIGEAAVRSAEREWPELIAAMRSHRERGTDPSAPEVRALGRRWTELVHAFTGGDAGIREGLGRMYEENGELRRRTGLDAPLVEYVRRVLAALEPTSPGRPS